MASKTVNSHWSLVISISLIALAISIVACKKTTAYSEEELKQYVLNPNNGLIKERTIGDVYIKVSYRPTDLLVAQDLRSESNPSQQKIDSLRNNYNQYLYFLLSISVKGKEILAYKTSQQEYDKLVQLLSFEMGQYVQFTTSANDTIPLADYIYPRMYGATGSTTVIFAFKKEKTKKSEWLQFQLKEFGLKTGNNQFRFEMSDIQQTPMLKFSPETTVYSSKTTES